MALTFTEGSISGDIERVNLDQLRAFYGKDPAPSHSASFAPYPNHAEPTGSNGAAISASNAASHHALLLINPHTSFFFRSKLQMVSEEGLNAYGASTWGQFFIYQGFNDRAGWMHTSSGVDAIDEYLENVTNKNGRYYYKYGSEDRPVTSAEITVPYKTPAGMAEKKFTVFRTHHGPIVRESGGKWVAIRLMRVPVKALTQSYTRTKARDYKSYWKTMELQANSSNNTIFADADGDIAYLHGNFIPRRDPKFDWTQPRRWQRPRNRVEGLLSVEETPHLLNPKSGWLYNSNNWPWSAAGPDSPKKENYPPYVENGGETARGLHGIRVLKEKRDFTLASLIGAAFDSYLTWFEKPIPALIKAWDDAPASDPLKDKLAGQIAALRNWDLRWSVDSVPTSLAVFWGGEIRREWENTRGVIPAPRLLQALAAASARLTADFRTGKTPWGEINRFQRLTGDIAQPFNDSAPSIPVGFPSSQWGSLASFGARANPGTKKWYGTSGNSFVAVVQFGPRFMPWQSPLAAKAETPSQRISTTRPSATPPATCAKCTSTAISSRTTPNANTIQAANWRRVVSGGITTRRRV